MRYLFVFLACECNIPGTTSGLHVCDPGTGQCVCKVDVFGQRCDVCKDGFHHLNEENPFLYFTINLIQFFIYFMRITYKPEATSSSPQHIYRQ
jgi:hypothetical protein